jgi:hypothetical protein
VRTRNINYFYFSATKATSIKFPAVQITNSLLILQYGLCNPIRRDHAIACRRCSFQKHSTNIINMVFRIVLFTDFAYRPEL